MIFVNRNHAIGLDGLQM